MSAAIRQPCSQYWTHTCHTVDSDVVIIAIYAYNKISAINELWIDFGTGKNIKMISVHEMVENIPKSIAQKLPFFHAFTGCDTVSMFYGIGKRLAWKTWMNFRQVDSAFTTFATNSGQSEMSMKIIERYVVLMYD